MLRKRRRAGDSRTTPFCGRPAKATPAVIADGSSRPGTTCAPATALGVSDRLQPTGADAGRCSPAVAKRNAVALVLQRHRPASRPARGVIGRVTHTPSRRHPTGFSVSPRKPRYGFSTGLSISIIPCANTAPRSRACAPSTPPSPPLQEPQSFKGGPARPKKENANRGSGSRSNIASIFSNSAAPACALHAGAGDP